MAYSSCSKLDHVCLTLFNFLLKYANGQPPCIKTTPIPSFEAYVSSSKVFVKFGRANRDAVVSFCFKVLKPFC